MILHPALRQLADMILAADAPSIEKLTLDEARGFSVTWSRQIGGDGPAIESVQDISVPVRHGFIPGRLYVPAGPLRALIIYFHGGGWVLGNIEIYDPVGRLVAAETGCATLVVDYRLAPEAPFPAGMQDCFDATVWASKAKDALLGSVLPLVIMGDSAGGNLAAVVAQLARGAGQPEIAAQILMYPNTDADPTTASFREFWDAPLFAGRSMEWFWSRYQPDPALRLGAEISPLRAASFAGLPPAIIVTVEHDPLRDEGEAYAAALRAASVRVISYRLDGLAHGFLNMLSVFDEPVRAMRRIAQELDELLVG